MCCNMQKWRPPLVTHLHHSTVCPLQAAVSRFIRQYDKTCQFRWKPATNSKLLLLDISDFFLFGELTSLHITQGYIHIYTQIRNRATSSCEHINTSAGWHTESSQDFYRSFKCGQLTGTVRHAKQGDFSSVDVCYGERGGWETTSSRPRRLAREVLRVPPRLTRVY